MANSSATASKRRRATALATLGAVAAVWVLAIVLGVLDGRLTDAIGGTASVAFAAAGTLVVFRRPENRLGAVFLVIAASSAVLGSGALYARHALRATPHWPAALPVAWLADAMATPVVGLIAGVLPQLFPTGRTLGGRWRWPFAAALGYIVLATIGNAFTPQKLESVPGRPNPYAIDSAKPVFSILVQLSAVCGVVALVGSVASLVVRWRRARRLERQQLKWFLVAICLLPIPLALHDIVPSVGQVAFSVLFAVIPGVIAIAILRYRLFELDRLISGSVGYAAVSAVVAGVYLAIVGIAAAATGSIPLAVHVIAAVAAAAAFHPVRMRLQRRVDRIFYGDRSRPYEAMTGLSQRLATTLTPDEVLPAVVATVASALRLPYVAIELRDGDGWATATAHGTLVGAPIPFAMTYQGETVGRMLVCPREAGEVLDERDSRLLTDLARQAGVAAEAVRSSSALLRSRAELVTAREEERRRLRRDLHDGLGPTLAGVTLGLHAAQSLVTTDSDEARRLLASLEGQVQEAIADIRRLVYGLRPPALDEFGLVRALQLQAAHMEVDADLVEISIASPDGGLGRLPAAVEVAAYRIITEALTNVTRHARASRCEVRLSLNGALEVDVTDDGRGLDPDTPAGVGLSAMRERAAELGGVLTVEALRRGTRVHARLPVAGAHD